MGQSLTNMIQPATEQIARALRASAGRMQDQQPLFSTATKLVFCSECYTERSKKNF
jgi:hypothetical protein